MDLLQVALVVLLAALAIGVVIWPIVRPTRNAVSSKPAGDQALSELIAKRDAALRAVKDLEFDYQTGKVSRDDFPAYEQTLKEQAIAAIQAVDDYQGRQRQLAATREAELDAALEAQIAALRRTPAATPHVVNSNGHPTTTGSTVDAAAAPQGAPAPHFCPQCGHAAATDDRFCARCGTSLAPVTPAG